MDVDNDIEEEVPSSDRSGIDSGVSSRLRFPPLPARGDDVGEDGALRGVGG